MSPCRLMAKRRTDFNGVNISKASYTPEEGEVVVSGFAKHKCSVKSADGNTITLSCVDVTDD